ncbi:hypothetical protein WOLCODRAFT_158515 [Wolfiporia cocos MD-104 SS10]|uniref:Uncharacterized protein n=1 Tax=Wolfiporia cocos (strain MD-104) TaxID=742152 RepID=A0A2H3JJN3_WOLCO|nr:hypothetical protein WOLCODRAFT_158515 [Wolfiporia cocos MD-104 SS10]
MWTAKWHLTRAHCQPNIQLAPLAAAFTSICISRIILNLREACFVKQDPSEYRNTTRNEMNDTLQFRPQRVTARSRDVPTTGTVPAIDVHASISEDIRADSVQSQMIEAHRREEGDVESARREIHRCFDDDLSDDLLTDDERA